MKRSLFIILTCGLILSACSDDSSRTIAVVYDTQTDTPIDTPIDIPAGPLVDQEEVCQANETACDGFVLKICGSDGKFIETPCGVNELCAKDGESHRCMSQAEYDRINSQTDKDCEAGQSKCEAGKRFVCDNEQWSEAEDCMIKGMICDDSGSEAICNFSTVIPEPVKECASGETRCNGNVIQTCSDEGKFVDGDSCGDNKQMCLMENGKAVCADNCDAGSTRCSGDILETCNGNGEFEATACDNPGQVCKTVNGNASCSDPDPEPECSGNGYRCQNNNVEQCVNGFYAVTTRCADHDMVCAESEGQFTCETPKCADGETMCGVGNTLFTCDSSGNWQETKCLLQEPKMICLPNGGANGSAACVEIEVSGSETLDSDGDTIPDTVEGRESNRDTDGDGKPDYQDTDSDDDGIPDSIEAGNGGNLNIPPVDSDYDGMPDYIDTDSDNNEILDKVEVGSDPLHPLDTDGNKIPDYIDYDNDGDGFSDLEEIIGLVSIANPPANNNQFSGTCTNGGSTKGSSDKPLDCDGDKIPDYMDTDSDNDTIPDKDEGLLIKNGKYARYSTDSDGDTLPDNIEAEKVGGVWTFPDSDEDGVPDMLELDSDGDSLSDAMEYALESQTPCSTNNMKPRKSKNTDGDLYNDAAEYAIAQETQKTGYEGKHYTPAEMICNPKVGVKTVYEFYFELPEGETKNDVLTFIPKVSKLDVMFNMDTTSSMGQEVLNLQERIRDYIIPQVRERVEDSGFGVSRFDDFPVSSSKNATPYGRSPDLPFVLHGAISKSETDVTNAVNLLSIHNGADIPESGYESLWQIVNGHDTSLTQVSWKNYDATKWTTQSYCTPPSGTWGCAGFRPQTLPVVIHITDADSHNSNSNAYSTSVVNNPHYSNQVHAAYNAKGARIISISAHSSSRISQLVTTSQTTNAIVPVCTFKDSSGNWQCGEKKCCTGSNDSSATANDPISGDLCVLSYQVKNASRMSNTLVDGIDALVKYGTYAVSTVIRGDSLSNGKTTACFIDKIVAKDYIAPPNEPEKTCNPKAVANNVNTNAYKDGFTNFAPGTSSTKKEGAKLTFTVYAKNNNCVEQNTTTQVFKAYIDVVNPTTGLLFGTQMVSIIIPPITEGSNE